MKIFNEITNLQTKKLNSVYQTNSNTSMYVKENGENIKWLEIKLQF